MIITLYYYQNKFNMFESIKSKENKETKDPSTLDVEIMDVKPTDVDLSKMKELTRPEDYITAEKRLKMILYPEMAKIMIDKQISVKKISWKETYILSKYNAGTNSVDDLLYIKSKETFQEVILYIEEILASHIEIVKIKWEVAALKEEVIGNNNSLENDDNTDETIAKDTDNTDETITKDTDVKMYPTGTIASVWNNWTENPNRWNQRNAESYLRNKGKI